MKDRIIGYVVIVAVLMLLVIPTILLIWQAISPKTVRQISFSSIKGLSFISLNDPVRMQGAEVGFIKTIDLRTTGTILTIETGKHLKIYEGYTVSVLAKGVMGERFLNITSGDSSKNEISPSQMLVGDVSTGPDEALAYIGKLKETIHELHQLSLELLRGSAARQSLVIKINNLTTLIDTLSGTITNTISTIDTQLIQSLDQVSLALEQGNTFMASLGSTLPAGIHTLNSTISVLSHICTKADSLLHTSEGVVAAVNDPDLVLWKELSPLITQTITQLQEVIGTLQRDSLKIPVRFW